MDFSPYSGLNVQIAVSMQLQRALHNPNRGKRVSSSDTIFKKTKRCILFNHKYSFCSSSAMRVRDFRHYGYHVGKVMRG